MIRAKKVAKRFVQLNAGLALGGIAFTGYIYPEAFRDPYSFWTALVRNNRQIECCAIMAWNYWRVGPDNWTTKLHYQEANRLNDMFIANGGVYIKTG